jgi:hypothetical protein
MAHHRGRPRALDWGCAALIAAWGATLLLPGDTLASSPAYELILARAPEDVWGWLCVGVGALHAGALVINGRAYEGMPLVRALAAAIGATLWGQFAVAFLEVSIHMGVASMGLPATLVPIVLNIYCAMRSGADAVHGRRARVGR